jgi:hypothetical protein
MTRPSNVLSGVSVGSQVRPRFTALMIFRISVRRTSTYPLISAEVVVSDTPDRFLLFAENEVRSGVKVTKQQAIVFLFSWT